MEQDTAHSFQESIQASFHSFHENAEKVREMVLSEENTSAFIETSHNYSEALENVCLYSLCMCADVTLQYMEDGIRSIRKKNPVGERNSNYGIEVLCSNLTEVHQDEDLSPIVLHNTSTDDSDDDRSTDTEGSDENF
uniref:Uncharacterized protein n=1 Tax=Corethron hystrix TaxID=216773 RepID=A0A7S1FYH4_9STRA|mmetsp:Transcript_37413/g.87254  ORF Transcript_37413/g.87254 Transcript_37413/m.87254 type:complete len:137 (+) Transcript_37413:1-411(+)